MKKRTINPERLIEPVGRAVTTNELAPNPIRSRNCWRGLLAGLNENVWRNDEEGQTIKQRAPLDKSSRRTRSGDAPLDGRRLLIHILVLMAPSVGIVGTLSRASLT